MTEITLKHCSVREWRPSDVDSLVAQANNVKVWRNLHDGFPHPYTRADAEAWIKQTMNATPDTVFAITVDGKAVGGIGFTRGTGELRLTATIGYWLGEDYWGRGITTEALRAVTDQTLANFDFARIEAYVFEWNLASARVLEKVGYTREARLRKRITKEGRTVDCFLYARLRG
ncbi:MAG TPA: GNAT family protein [Candidatus Eisenbacteria bacterium]|nr:GNAT family protein [Candidatus Eisenbacteria bacterium]